LNCGEIYKKDASQQSVARVILRYGVHGVLPLELKRFI